MDKYGIGQDAYCYPGTTVLSNRLNIQDDAELFRAERDFSELAASQIGFTPPPYDLPYLQQLHRTQAWVDANIDAVVCDYSALERIFGRCICPTVIE